MGKTATQKDKEKAKGDSKKKPTIKDIIDKKKGGGKSKKKWSKTKSKEKLNNSVFWTKALWDKCSKDLLAKEPYISPSVVSDKLKVNVSNARAAIKQLVEDGKLVPYNGESHARWCAYVKSAEFIKELEAKPKVVETTKKGGDNKQQKQDKQEKKK